LGELFEALVEFVVGSETVRASAGVAWVRDLEVGSEWVRECWHRFLEAVGLVGPVGSRAEAVAGRVDGSAVRLDRVVVLIAGRRLGWCVRVGFGHEGLLGLGWLEQG
jgi:hypothetical protein